MSILLDALRKSEEQRRLGETPTLQTNVSAEEGRSGDRQPWIPLALILLSAGAISWMGMAQFRQDDALPVSAQRKGSSPAVTVSQPGTGEAKSVPATGEQAKARTTRTRAKSNSAATTPVKDYVVDDPAPVSPADLPASGGKDTVDMASGQSAAPGVVTGADDRGHDVERGASRRLTHVEIPADPPAEAAGSREGNGVTEPGSGGPVATGQAAYAPQTISYWQLPQTLREEMGEFRISVLVYAENPANRFLLVNGSRLREQEETDGGVRLETIERDRAVFTYQNYRFHLKN